MKKRMPKIISPLKKMQPNGFTHFNAKEEAMMVDVSAKEITCREAVAEGHIHVGKEVMEKIQRAAVKKGNVLETARLAGIMAAKKTAELIPLCHCLPLDQVTIDFEIAEEHIQIRSVVKSTGKTGVEMEALTAVTVSALTIYDMCKALNKGMTLGPFFLTRKSGGKSGLYERADQGILP